MRTVTNVRDLGAGPFTARPFPRPNSRGWWLVSAPSQVDPGQNAEYARYENEMTFTPKTKEN